MAAVIGSWLPSKVPLSDGLSLSRGQAPDPARRNISTTELCTHGSMQAPRLPPDSTAFGIRQAAFEQHQSLQPQESAAGDGLDAALADAQLQRDCQQRLAALVGVLRADHLQVAPACRASSFTALLRRPRSVCVMA